MSGIKLKNMEIKLTTKLEKNINRNNEKIIIFSISHSFFNIELIAMEKRPYHHLPDGTFRNPEGSPERDPNVKWSYKIFNEERKKLKLKFLKITLFQNKVLEDLKKIKIMIILLG